jgi:hypothetical protein
MFDSIEYLINEKKLQQDLTAIGKSIRARNGLKLAAEKIQQCALIARFYNIIKQDKTSNQISLHRFY